MKAETLLSAYDGLADLQSEIGAVVSGAQWTASYLAGRILLATGRDVPVSAVKSALELSGVAQQPGGRFEDADIADALSSNGFHRNRRRLAALAGRPGADG